MKRHTLGAALAMALLSGASTAALAHGPGGGHHGASKKEQTDWGIAA